MIDNEDEVEIKIEYFESVEEDPLFDGDKTKIFKHRSPLSNNNSDKTDGTNTSYLYVDEEIGVNENNGAEQEILLSEQENSATWYKSVDNLGRYVCKFCEISYSTVQTLRYHIKTKHSSNYHEIKNRPNGVKQRKVKCYICKKKFKNISALKSHSKTHGLNDKNICFICYATFEEHNDLLCHMTNKHESTKTKIHICSICGYSTAKMYHYKQHLSTHTNIKTIKCQYCSYSTNRISNLKIHEQIHSIEKLYLCEHQGCDYRCTTKAALRSHQLIHNKSKYMLYCDKCSYNTVYVQNLDKHLDSHRRNKIR